MFPAKTSLVKPCQSLRTSADLRSNFSFEVYSADAFLLAASKGIKLKPFPSLLTLFPARNEEQQYHSQTK